MSSKKVIPLFLVSMSEEVLKPVCDVLMSGYVGQGPRVEEFEALLRNHFGVSHLNTTNSATSALQLAVKMIYREGMEVLSTPLTCLATNFSILSAGLRLKWVDVNPETGNMDLDDLKRKINGSSCGVMVVHWGGYPVDIDRLKDIGLPVIEDCSHSWGSKYKGRLVGTHGNLSAFSFQAIKHFSTTDGGLLICPNEDTYKRTRLLRWYGIDRDTLSQDLRCEQDVPEAGYKFHMNDLNAVIGIYNYKRSLEVVKRHKENAAFYNEKLKGVTGVTLMRNDPGFDSSYWIYTLKVDRRDDFARAMKEKGIMTSRVHERNDKHSCVARFKEHLPNLDAFCKVMTNIPVGWWVTDEDREYIVDAIKGGW
jgi:dTDP-4-amino-4,6-dideoxygalactose transaminase